MRLRAPPISTLLEILVCYRNRATPDARDVEISTLLEILGFNLLQSTTQLHGTISTLLEILVRADALATMTQRIVFQPFLRF